MGSISDEKYSVLFDKIHILKLFKSYYSIFYKGANNAR